MEMKFVRLSDCCEIQPPKSEAKKILEPTDLVSFVPMKNLGINSFELELDENRQLSEVSGSYTYFAENDVLLAKITPCFENGKLGIARGLTNGVGFGSSEFIVFRPSNELLAEYLYYFLLRPIFREQGQAVMTGAVGHKRVPKEYIESTLIPLPLIEEQKRIVAILDRAFADIEQARATAETNLKNARELFDSYLQQVFSKGVEVENTSNLEDLVSSDCSLSYGIVQPGDEYPNGLPVVRPTDLTSKIISLNGLKLINPKLADSYKRTTLQGGELLLCVRGATGVISIASDELKGANVTRGIVPIRFKPEKLLQEYGYYQFISKNIQNQVSERTYGAALMQINIRDVKKLKFSLPSVEEQKEAIVTLNEISKLVDALEHVYQCKIEKFEELKKTILQKAFTGELTKSKGIAA